MECGFTEALSVIHNLAAQSCLSQRDLPNELNMLFNQIALLDNQGC